MIIQWKYIGDIYGKIIQDMPCCMNHYSFWQDDGRRVCRIHGRSGGIRYGPLVKGAGIVLSLCCHEWCFFPFSLVLGKNIHGNTLYPGFCTTEQMGSFPFCLQVESTALPSFTIYVFLNSPELDIHGEMVSQDICLGYVGGRFCSKTMPCGFVV